MYFLLTILISGCTSVQLENMEKNVNQYIENERTEMEKNESIESGLSNEVERVFIELNYLGSLDEISYKMHYTALDLHPDEEFTWWNYYTVNEYLSSTYYNAIFSDEIDKEKHDIIISFGRKLNNIYYYENDYFSDPKWPMEGYRARPIFEKDYIHNSAYVYLINKTDLADSELASRDMSSFLEGNIPFELPPAGDEVNKSE